MAAEQADGLRRGGSGQWRGTALAAGNTAAEREVTKAKECQHHKKQQHEKGKATVERNDSAVSDSTIDKVGTIEKEAHLEHGGEGGARVCAGARGMALTAEQARGLLFGST